MTIALKGEEVAPRIEERLPGAVLEVRERHVLLKSDIILDVAKFLYSEPGLEFDYLVDITAVDYIDYFELIYQLVSIKHNHGTVLKARCYERENPSLPSVISVWQGADLQEREVYDLMGVSFEGHPNLKRLLLWEGFPGHPLRRDYIER